MSDLSGVTAEDIREAAFGFTIPEGAQVDGALLKLIDKAELRILARVPDLADRIAATTTSLAAVASVVEDMVLRVAANPEGKKSESIDDYSWSLDASVSSGRLYLSDEELELLIPTTRPRSVGTIRIGVPSWRLPR